MLTSTREVNGAGMRASSSWGYHLEVGDPVTKKSLSLLRKGCNDGGKLLLLFSGIRKQLLELQLPVDVHLFNDDVEL